VYLGSSNLYPSHITSPGRVRSHSFAPTLEALHTLISRPPRPHEPAVLGDEGPQLGKREDASGGGAAVVCVGCVGRHLLKEFDNLQGAKGLRVCVHGAEKKFWRESGNCGGGRQIFVGAFVWLASSCFLISSSQNCQKDFCTSQLSEKTTTDAVSSFPFTSVRTAHDASQAQRPPQ
jgi:hypothetical protein